MKKINQYIESVFTSPDPVLEDVVASIEENDMRQISVPPASGKLLTMLASISGAKRVLEIGALGGYSGICLARGWPKAARSLRLSLSTIMPSWLTATSRKPASVTGSPT